MLKYMLAASVAIVGLSATAYAGEGHGDPFPGPDNAVTEQVQPYGYTMGADAPFNYFGVNTPTPMASYKQAPGNPDDPYPFQMNGQLIQVQPAPRTSVATSPAAAAGRHG